MKMLKMYPSYVCSVSLFVRMSPSTPSLTVGMLCTLPCWSIFYVSFPYILSVSFVPFPDCRNALFSLLTSLYSFPDSQYATCPIITVGMLEL